MDKPGKHTFPDYDAEVEALAKHLPSAKREAAAIRRRTAREIKASALAAETLKKQTAREMKEGARAAKRWTKDSIARQKKIKLRGPTPEPNYKPANKSAPLPPPSGSSTLAADWNIPAPRPVRLAAAIADAYYQPDNPKAITLLRIKQAIVDLNHIMVLLDDLYPI